MSADRGRFTGGKEPAQLFILLHELGHLTGALDADMDDQNKVDKNDEALEKNCKSTIKKFGK